MLEQNFAQEVQLLQSAISTSDKNVHLLNTRIQTIEKNSTTALNDAVATAVDIKLKSIDAAIAELKSTPTPRSSAPKQRTGSSGPVHEAKHAVLERAHRVIIVGFPRKMMQASLKRAADMVIIAGSPQDRPRPIVRTYDMTRKIVLDFADSTKASDFLNMMSSKGPIAFQDPIYPQQQIMLRAKRDMEPGTRLLFLAMGKVRGAFATVLKQAGKEMGSNGLGGDVYVLRSAEDPVLLCHLELVTSDSEPPHVTINFLPDQFAEFHELVSPLIPRLQEGIDHLNDSLPF